MYICNEDYMPLDIKEAVYKFLKKRNVTKPVEVYWGRGIDEAVFLYSKDKTKTTLAFIDDPVMTEFALQNIGEVESRFDYILTNSQELLEHSNKFINYEHRSP